MDALVRRDRWWLVVGLLAVVAVAWVWLLDGAGMAMSAIEMTAMAGMDGWLMPPEAWTPGHALRVFTMWWVMMVAMMLPSAVPTLLLFARVNRQHKAAGPAVLPTALFACGYLSVWGAFSAGAAAAQWGLESARLLSPMLEASSRWLAVVILVAAGAWQLTPLKDVCLRHCRSPLSFLIEHWRQGRTGALRMGAHHGRLCLGCCWFLMGLLFVGGVMNLVWIAGLAIYVLLEKTVPHGPWLGRATGIALLVWGILLATQIP